MLYLIIKCYFLPLFCWAFKTVFFSVNSVPIKYLESYIFFTHLCILCNKMPQRRDSAGAVCNSSMAIFWFLMYLILFLGGRVGFFLGNHIYVKLCNSGLCVKMSSFQHACTCAMPRKLYSSF